MLELREVVYVDGVRTAFCRATADGLFARTRADDMAVKTARELLRRNPSLPPERSDDVAFAATAQVGDQDRTRPCSGWASSDVARRRLEHDVVTPDAVSARTLRYALPGTARR